MLITLPNFGDERAIANALRWSELNVPVLIHAFPDDEKNMDLKDRRDSFCGKMSACNNLQAVRHQVHADQVAYDGPGERGISRRPGAASAPSAG